jgi:hypothetical protein
MVTARTFAIAVIAAAIIAGWWTWATMPMATQSRHLPRAPLMLYSEIGWGGPKMRTLINLFAGAVLFLASDALAAEPPVLSCTDAAATGFKWQKSSKEPDAVRFEPDRFTVRIISDEERVITRTIGDTAGEPLKFLCQRPFGPRSPAPKPLAQSNGCSRGMDTFAPTCPVSKRTSRLRTGLVRNSRPSTHLPRAPLSLYSEIG